MKRYQTLIITITIITLLSNCRKQPTVGFSLDDETPQSDQVLSFLNETVDAETYEWDFGDGFTSIEENPTHLYDEAGVYTVTLTAYSKKQKKSSTYAKTITVSSSTLDLIANLWSYDFVLLKSYENGDLTEVFTIDMDESYEVHTLEFFGDFTYINTTDDVETPGDWSIDIENNTFTSDGDTLNILELTNTVFNMGKESDNYTSGGITYIDSLFILLSR